MNQVLRRPVIYNLLKASGIDYIENDEKGKYRIQREVISILREEYDRIVDLILSGPYGAINRLIHAYPVRTTLLQRDIYHSVIQNLPACYHEWISRKENTWSKMCETPQTRRYSPDSRRILRSSTMKLWIKIRIQQKTIAFAKYRMSHKAFEYMYPVIQYHLCVCLAVSKGIAKSKEKLTLTSDIVTSAILQVFNRNKNNIVSDPITFDTYIVNEDTNETSTTLVDTTPTNELTTYSADHLDINNTDIPVNTTHDVTTDNSVELNILDEIPVIHDVYDADSITKTV